MQLANFDLTMEKTANEFLPDESFHAKTAEEMSALLRRGLCTMAFQPVMDLGSQTVFGYEAFIRDSNGIPVSDPAVVFNRKGYLPKDVLVRLDIACIGSALRSAMVLAKQHRLFLNIHPYTISYLFDMRDIFLELLEELVINPAHIVLEISQLADITVPFEIGRLLSGLTQTGVKIAVDNHGGAFDLSFPWADLKPSYIKIDKLYLYDIHLSGKKQAMLRSFEFMIRQRGQQLVATGIEHQEQEQMLKTIGITLAQGFWFGRPRPAEEWTGKGAAA